MVASTYSKKDVSLTYRHTSISLANPEIPPHFFDSAIIYGVADTK